jgi:hypothetical protein
VIYPVALRMRLAVLALAMEPWLLAAPRPVPEIDARLVAAGLPARSPYRQITRIRLALDGAFPGAWTMEGRGPRGVVCLLSERLEEAAGRRGTRFVAPPSPVPSPPTPPRPILSAADLPPARKPSPEDVATRQGATGPWRNLRGRGKTAGVRQRESVEDAVARGALTRLPAVGTPEHRAFVAARRAADPKGPGSEDRRNPLLPEIDADDP